MHFVCGVQTHIVAGVEVSSSMSHDSPYYKPLLEQTAKAGFTMKEICAEKGYISGDNLQTTVDLGAQPFIRSKPTRQAREIASFVALAIRLQKYVADRA